jgi:soluble lytic murein transglycosylase
MITLIRPIPILLLIAASTLCLGQHAVICHAAPSVIEAQEEILLEGKKRFDAGQPAKAIEHWRHMSPDTIYGPVACILAARAYEAMGRLDRAETVLRELLEVHPDSPYKDIAKQALLDVVYRQEKDEALKMLDDEIDKASRSGKPPLLLKAARFERKQKHYKAAEQYYRILYFDYPATVEGMAAADELAWLVFHGKIEKPSIPDKRQLERAERLFRRGRFDRAAKIYQRLLKDDSDNKSLALDYGRSLYKGRQNKEAIAVLKKLVGTSTPSAVRLEALHTLSLVYWRIDREDKFIACCKELIKEGSPRYRRKALFNLGAHYLERSRLDKAETFFRKFLKASSNRSSKAYVLWKIAWIEYRKQDYQAAARAFKEVGRLSDGGYRNPAAYWQARCLMLSGSKDRAVTILERLAATDPLDYYGQEAADQLEDMGRAPPVPKNNRSDFPDVNIPKKYQSHELVIAARKLLEIGLPEFAMLNLEELPATVKSHPALVLLRAQTAHEARQYRKAQEILRSSFAAFMDNPPADAPDEFIEIAYPRVMKSHTERWAKKHSVDPHLVWAVIRQESRYDATAVSPAGALGYMQVTPGASGLVKRKGSVPADVIAKILEPEKNLQLGIRILSENIERFKGELVPAIASYNADIRKVRQWVKRNGKMSRDEFIESIPYQETRLYVKKVLANYRAYSRLHRKKALAGYW